MLHVYYCEYRVCGNFASRYVVASNKSKSSRTYSLAL